MPDCTICNVCDAPGSYESAADVAGVACPIRRFRKDQFTVWRCTNCASLHCKEDPDLSFYYESYPGHREQLDHATRITCRNRLRLLERRGMQRGWRVLDYGCGGGGFVTFLQENGYTRAVGYEPYVDKFSDPTLLRHRYDLVVSYDVVEHLDDTREYFKTVAGLLDVGGLAVVGTPNADHISLSRRPVQNELHQPYHRHILSERVLRTLADDYGFETEHVHRRLYIDSLVPGLNTRFLWAYVDACDGVIDAAFEPPRLGLILRSPKLLGLMFFGYFLPPKSNILITFRKVREVASMATKPAIRVAG
jgi:2-polyprenyl-3-methyl-5-hydroxy-6-metoxy-1,4-benzoquinol methylase